MKYQVNKEAVEACQTYISKTPSYSVLTILKTNNLANRLEDKGMGRYVVACPFHNDDKPSLNIRDEDSAWRCFSCSRQGYSLQMLYEISKNINKSSATFYQFLNSLLISDPAMKASTGFVSIYHKANDFKYDQPYVRKMFVPSKEMPVKSYLELSDKMKKLGLTSKEQIRLAILYMQNDMKPDEILRHLQGTQTDVLEEGEESFFDIDISGFLS